jgi:circadian clock protein KaiC
MLGQLPKSLTGIQGLDEVTDGGLPQGRTTLIYGSAGSGKTLLGVEFLVNGATKYNEPGVLMTFEETAEEITQNVASLGWDIEQLVSNHQLLLDHVFIPADQIEVNGSYDLEGLFIRLNSAIQEIGAKRVVLDTIEVLFSTMDNHIVRSELRRLFSWLKSQGVTAIITGELGSHNSTLQGIEEYVSDCVIRLEQRTSEDLATRYLQILKYRGSKHGSNEYPFLINDNGISVVPITSVGLNSEVSNERISSGVPRLDTMLGGLGYYRGSSILVTGTAGTGKTSLANYFASSTCDHGERCLYLATEESPQQIVRNQRSIGLDLQHHVERGLLQFESVRPTAYGLEMRLANIYNWVQEFQPSLVVVDPMSNLATSSTIRQTKNFLMRLIELFKSCQITVFFTDLLLLGGDSEAIKVGIPSLMDTWIELRTLENNGERNRALYVLKSRGMQHSNQVREFVLSSKGIELLDVYLGESDFLIGSARIAQEAKDKLEQHKRYQDLERKKRQLDQQQSLLQAQITALQFQLVVEREDFEAIYQQDQLSQKAITDSKDLMADLRDADAINP